MSFAIDTGAYQPASKSAAAEGLPISWRGRGEHAERFHRQFIARLWSEIETIDDLDALMEAESLCIDALWLSHPEYAERIDAQAAELRAILRGQKSAPAENPSPAVPGNPSAHYGNDGKGKTDDFFF